jgi:hypothetical protein
MKYSTPFVVRLVCAVSLWICAAVTLGLSSEVESKVGFPPWIVSLISSSRSSPFQSPQINSRGFNTSWLPYIIFVGSFTLIFETIFLLIRLIATKSAGAWVIVDICWSVLMYFMWLGEYLVVVSLRTQKPSVAKGVSGGTPCRRQRQGCCRRITTGRTYQLKTRN